MTLGTSKTMTLWLCLGIFLLATALAAISSNTLRFVDEEDYHKLAIQIINTHQYLDESLQTTASRPPGYPAFLAALYSLGSAAPIVAKIANAIALALSAWMLAQLATKIAPRSRNFAPLLIFAYPVLFFSSATLYPQTMGGLFLLVFINQIIYSPRKFINAFFSGIVYGVLILFIPIFIFLIPVFLAWVIIKESITRRASVYYAVGILVGISVILLPWSARNLVQMNAIIPVSTNSGINLLLGNSENTLPNGGTLTDISSYTSQAKKLAINEVETDAFYKKSAIEWVSENPKQAAKLYLLKLLNNFNYKNSLATTSQESGWKNFLMFLTYYPLLILAFSGLITKRKMSNVEFLVILIYFAGAFAYAIFFTRIRFRLPFDLLLILPAAINLSYFISNFSDRKRHTLRLRTDS